MTMPQMAPNMVQSLAGSAALPEGREAARTDISRVTEDAYRTRRYDPTPLSTAVTICPTSIFPAYSSLARKIKMPRPV